MPLRNTRKSTPKRDILVDLLIFPFYCFIFIIICIYAVVTITKGALEILVAYIDKSIKRVRR